MRVGDLDALKEAVINNFDNLQAYFPKDFIEEIDNAPTIKTFNITDIEEQYCKGLEKGLSEWETERPTGEWNYIQADMCVCPFCGAMPHKEYKNFCAKCGAKMKVKKND